jgi:hypothetical protein
MVPLSYKSKLIPMKKIILFSLLATLTLTTFAQPWSGNAANSTLQVRVGNTASVTPPARYFDSTYYLMFNLSDSTLYRYTYKNPTWVKVFSGGGGGGGSSNNIYNTDSSIAANRTVNLNGKTLTFDAATRNRSLLINMNDSTIRFKNFTGYYQMDSINATTGSAVLYFPTSSTDAESPDFMMGHRMTTKNGGNREEEDYSFGYNLKGDGTRANTSLPAMGWLYNFNRYTTTTALNHNIYLTAIDSAGTQVNVMNYNFLPATGVKSGTITWSSNSVNYINPAIPSNAIYGTYYRISQNLIELIGLTPRWRLTDSSNASNHGDIYFNNQDLFIVPTRYLYLNGTAKITTAAIGHVEVLSATLPTTSSLGTNVTSATVQSGGNDHCFQLVVVTSGNVSGTICSITYNSAYLATPIVVVTPANTTTGSAITGGYIAGNGTSTNSASIGGSITGAGTYTFNVITN